MRLTVRQSDIIRCIYNGMEISVKQIAVSVGVTSSTVRNEIQAMKDFFESYGIDVRINEKNQLRVLGRERMAQMVQDTKMYTEFAVNNQIFLMLLLHSGYMTIQEIADELFVSKSLVDKQLPTVLKKYAGQIESMRHYGIRYSQDELRRRMAFVDLLKNYMVGNDLEGEFVQFHKTHFPVLNYFTSVQLSRVARMMRTTLNEKRITFADDSVCQLYLYMLITAYRNDKNETIHEDSAVIQSILRLGSSQDYSFLIDKLTPEMDDRYLKNESRFFQYLFLGLRKNKSPDRGRMIAEMSPVLQEIFRKIREVLLFDLDNDTDLFEGLAIHIYTAILRNIPMEEYQMEQWDIQEFRRQYPIGIEMASIAAEIIAEKLDCTVNDEDLLYLAFHFQSAVERFNTNAKKVKAIIICHYNVAAAKLICERIRRRFTEIDIAGIYSLQEFKNCTLSKIDLVLTTDKIPSMSIETIYITPMLKETEMQVIAEFVEKKRISERMILKIQEADVIHLSCVGSKEGAIEKSVAYLERIDYVDDRYLRSVLERERISSTNLKYIAVPHGNPQFVRDTKLVITRIDEPVRWGTADVSCVFLFAYNDKMLEENPLFMGNFYRNLAKPSVEEQIRDLKAVSDEIFKRELLEILM